MKRVIIILCIASAAVMVGCQGERSNPNDGRKAIELITESTLGWVLPGDEVNETRMGKGVHNGWYNHEVYMTYFESSIYDPEQNFYFDPATNPATYVTTIDPNYHGGFTAAGQYLTTSGSGSYGIPWGIESTVNHNLLKGRVVMNTGRTAFTPTLFYPPVSWVYLRGFFPIDDIMPSCVQVNSNTDYVLHRSAVGTRYDGRFYFPSGASAAGFNNDPSDPQYSFNVDPMWSAGNKLPIVEWKIDGKHDIMVSNCVSANLNPLNMFEVRNRISNGLYPDNGNTLATTETHDGHPDAQLEFVHLLSRMSFGITASTGWPQTFKLVEIQIRGVHRNLYINLLENNSLQYPYTPPTGYPNYGAASGTLNTEARNITLYTVDRLPAYNAATDTPTNLATNSSRFAEESGTADSYLHTLTNVWTTPLDLTQYTPDPYTNDPRESMPVSYFMIQPHEYFQIWCKLRNDIDGTYEWVPVTDITSAVAGNPTGDITKGLMRRNSAYIMHINFRLVQGRITTNALWSPVVMADYNSTGTNNPDLGVGSLNPDENRWW